MKYLDENIEVSVSGITVPLAGTYVYTVKDKADNVVFIGNTYLNAGDTTKTIDITDILSNLKWKAPLKKPLVDNDSRVNNVNQYFITLAIGSTVYTSETIDVAFVYRYPNRKASLEAQLFNGGSVSGVKFQNCLQGAKNGVCELLPIIPYKLTNEYGIGVVGELVSGSTIYANVPTQFELNGQLYYNNPIQSSMKGMSGSSFRTLSSLFSTARESVVTTEAVMSGYSRDYDVEYPLYYTFIDPTVILPSAVTVYTAAGIKNNYSLGVNHSIDIEMELADGDSIYITHNLADSSTYLKLGGSEFSSGTVHVEFRAWLRGDNMAFMVSNLKLSKGNQGQDETYVDYSIPNQLVGEAIYAEDIQGGADEIQIINYLMSLGNSYESAVNIYDKVSDGKTQIVFTGSSEEVSEIYPQMSAYFDCYRDDYYGSASQHIAEVDKGCLSKYYLMWQDRYGGYQSQPFDKTETFSIDYTYDEMKDYQNARRNITIKAQGKWKVQTNWLDEKYYPYYESIFSSPYVLLYDTEEDKSYNVIVTDKKYTEKTWKNQHKFFNLELNLELNKVQNILY